MDNSSDRINVSAAFEILLKGIEAEIEHVNRTGSHAFEAAEYDRAREALGRVEELTAYRDKVTALSKEWQALSPPHEEEAGAAPVEPLNPTRPSSANPAKTADHHERRDLGRIDRGVATPRVSYYRPILQALVELGGSARSADILSRVEALMKHVHSQIDYEPRKSNPDTVRWRNSANWARLDMVEEGLLKRGSPHGTWEITDEGRHYLTTYRP